MLEHFRSWIKTHKVLTVLIAISVLAFGVLAYEKITLEQNRRAFIDARKAIDIVYVDIVKQVGQPDNFRRSNTCSRPSMEFQRGPLSCDVSTDFIYGVSNKEEADQLKAKIQAVFKQHGDILIPSPAPPSDIHPIPAPGNNTDSSNDFYKSKKGLDCSVKYTNNRPDEISLKLGTGNLKIFSTTTGCGGSARTEFYSIYESST